MGQHRYWLALSLIKGLGPVTIKQVVTAFGEAKAVFSQRADQIIAVAGITQSRAQLIASFKDWQLVDNTIEAVQKAGAALVTFNDPDYPEELKQLYDPPSVLFVKGELLSNDKFAVSIVGSRTCTEYGRNVTQKMTASLCAKGFTIVSGMARGIDTVAHSSALKAGGRTFAVLGSGIDVPYPSENMPLFHKIPDSGAVISEFPPGTRPIRENFPKRNRLISALSLGTLVIEASDKSGALITARCAVDQGKEVFAIPGNINWLTSKGTHDLIKKGAKLVDNPDDIVEELAPLLKGFLREARIRQLPPLNEEEQAVLKTCDREPIHIDDIIRQTSMPPSRVMSVLLALELKGLIRQWEGKKFSGA
ncbi:MAG TPA: DNA-processing protein DprA [Thermodesulfovibrionia bacterium]|nr:DNA-processing protein DprA [Thermodesulfovibrionia bacterium]